MSELPGSEVFEALVAEVDSHEGLQCSDCKLSTRQKGLQTMGIYLSLVYEVDPGFLASPGSQSKDGFRHIAELAYHPQSGPWVQVSTFGKDMPVSRRHTVRSSSQFNLADPGSVEGILDLLKGQTRLWRGRMGR